MKNIWLWIIGIGIILTIGLGFLLGLGFVRIQSMPINWMVGGSNVWREGNWHHHGIRWGISMMGVFWGLLMLLVVLGLLTLLIVGIVLLVRTLQQPNRDQSDSRVMFCIQCGKKIAPDWQVCPYCGEPLKGE